MTLDLSFVVLLAGYIFVMQCHWTRFVARQQDGYQILFGSGVAGVVLLAISYVTVSTVSCPWASENWNSLVPCELEGPVSRSICLSLLLSIVSVILINLFISDRKGVERAINREGNELEILLVRSLQESAPVEIVLKRGIVYVGIVTRIDPPSKRENHVELDPLLHGVMDSQDIIRIQDNNPQHSSKVMLPIGDIHRARLLSGPEDLT